MNLPIIPTIKSVTDLRYQTAEIMRLVNQGQPVVVTKDNDTLAIIFSPRDYQKILDMYNELEEKKEVFFLESVIEKGDEFSDFVSFDKKIRKKSGRR